MVREEVRDVGNSFRFNLPASSVISRIIRTCMGVLHNILCIDR